MQRSLPTITDTARAEARDRLLALPRVHLAALPTPLQRLPRFSDALGADVWIKRDDMGELGLAGNKVRKFELVLGAARAGGADTLVTTGAVQSNSARAGAAAAARLGMRCILVLTGAPPAASTANLLLDELFGAEVRLVGAIGWQELGPVLAAVADEVRSDGGRPVVAPVGASSPLGSLGFALGYLELRDQLRTDGPAGDAAPVLVHASTSGGTHSGLVVGRLLAGSGPHVVGVNAGRVLADPAADLARLATAAAAHIGLEVTVDAASIDLDDDHGGPAYGAVTPDGVEAIRLLARTEGIVCDPVYSGKALAALVTRVRDGRLGDRPVVFWHTGGWHALFDPHYGGSVLASGPTG
jgi:1-aminocyclopropane-1-carboxylate deaminase/D-cysteine desulfhydrase